MRINGEGEPGASVKAGGARTVVGVDGRFSLNGVCVAEGDNLIEPETTDAAGNASRTIVEITGIAGVEGQPVLLWNDVTLAAIVDNAETPTQASRILAMQSVAVFDVIAAIDDSQAFLVDADAGDGASLAAAVAVASHGELLYAFPAFEAELDAFLAEALADVPEGAGRTAGEALGAAVAQGVIAIRDVDGWDDFATNPGSERPGEWRETGPLFEPAADPQWIDVTTWALSSGDQFRAAPPLPTPSPRSRRSGRPRPRPAPPISWRPRASGRTAAAPRPRRGAGTPSPST